MQYNFVPVIACNLCGAPPACFTPVGLRLNGSQGRRPKAATGIAVSVKKCRQCGLIFSDPQPIPPSIEDHYSIPPSHYWANLASDVPHGYFARQLEEVGKLLGQSGHGMTALDIGAGQGFSMVAMSRAGFDVVGIEPSNAFREYAIATHGLCPEQVLHTAVEEAEFPNHSFDFINFGAVLEHIYDPAGAIEKCIPWLKPGGIIHAEVPSSGHLMSKFINAYFRLRGTNYVTNLSPMHAPFHLFEFGLQSFRLHGLRAGYDVTQHYFRVCSIYHIPKLLHAPLRWWMERTNTGMQLTVYLRAS